MLSEIITDGLFAAVAGVGFSSISQPPKKAYPVIVLLAAIGYSMRFALMNMLAMNITLACLFASLIIGFLAIPLARLIHCPAETFSFPSLLPMIPGMYAHRAIQFLVACLQTQNEDGFMHCMYMFCYNGMTAICVIGIMVTGVTIPIFILKQFSFEVTRMPAYKKLKRKHIVRIKLLK